MAFVSASTEVIEAPSSCGAFRLRYESRDAPIHRIQLKGESKLKLTVCEQQDTINPDDHDQQTAKTTEPTSAKARQK
jgi:hypothetical protein